jgi:hypothetical protein
VPKKRKKGRMKSPGKAKKGEGSEYWKILDKINRQS